MSADHWLEADLGGSEPAEIAGTDLNITYNLSRMLAEAGYPGHREIAGQQAGPLAEMFGMVASRLREDPDRFDQFAPENGWGDRHGAIVWAESFAALCARYPRAVIGASL